MRLLEYSNDGRFSLTQFFDNLPRFAILSHTWGPEEVSFRDMMEGIGTSKSGFDKIQTRQLAILLGGHMLYRQIEQY